MSFFILLASSTLNISFVTTFLDCVTTFNVDGNSCRLPDAKTEFVIAKCASTTYQNKGGQFPVNNVFVKPKTCHAFNANSVNKPKTTV